jgi:zinc transport system ATP-binding protein
VGLDDRADVDVSTLSGGQQRRVLIARALAARPDVLLMDEPTAGVDLASQQVLSEVLARLAGRGATMLIVTHELQAVQDVLTRIIQVNGGQITFDGTPADYALTQGGLEAGGDGHHHDDDDELPAGFPAAGPLDHISQLPGGHGA